MSDPLPLADAAARLRGKPGRPPKSRFEVTTVIPVGPRVLDVKAAARYLCISEDAVRDLAARKELRRVRLPGVGNRDLTRVLFDRQDLDALVERMKDDRP
jgi:Helix-turn-helix domain